MAFMALTDEDLTPEGRRSVRKLIVDDGPDPAPMIRWYVNGRTFRTLPVTTENEALSDEWLAGYRRKLEALRDVVLGPAAKAKADGYTTTEIRAAYVAAVLALSVAVGAEFE